MSTKARPLSGATTAGGWVAPFRLSDASRSALSERGWTGAMLAELDKRVEYARFDLSIPMATDAQVVAALESVARAAAGLHAELKGLDWRTRHILDEKIARHLPDLERIRLTKEAMALSVLVHSVLRQSPRPMTRRGPPVKMLNNAVARIVREIMVEHGAKDGSAAVATTAILRELGGWLAADPARQPLRRAAKTQR